MLVSLCSREFDPDGSVLIRSLPNSQLGNLSRRVNRVRTLDGRSYLNDTGQTDADRTISIRFREPYPVVQAVKRILSLYPLVTLANSEGCFLGVCESLSTSTDGELALTFLVQERLDDGFTV